MQVQTLEHILMRTRGVSSDTAQQMKIYQKILNEKLHCMCSMEKAQSE